MKRVGVCTTVGRSVGRAVDHPHASMTNERNEHALSSQDDFFRNVDR